ncbi:MAG: C1 family peptidase [Clostridia bacterium]|nr:C1 family peptidase [Clostridia bacterium]
MNLKRFKRIFATAIILLCFFVANVQISVAYALQLNNEEEKIERILDREDLIKLPVDREDLIKLPVEKPLLPTLPNDFRPQINPDLLSPLPEQYCLRDDYLTFAQHQDKNGFCWNFAATMAASTTIMKATNEYYDFSELWTGISCYVPKKSYAKIGAGGSFSMQQKAMQRNGLMLESDLPYQNAYIVSNENAEDYYNFFNQYANDDLANTLVSDSSTSFSRSDVDAIKRHLVNNGSLYLAFSFKTGFLEENGVYSLTPNQTSTTSNHAVSLIGWDDNYQKEFYLDGSDTPTVFKGAWIILNSYTESNGKDGVSLIFYEDKNIYDIRGYRYKKDTDKAFYFYDKIESGYAYPTHVKGKYYGSLTAETAPTKQLNVFYDDVDLEYSYEISNGASVDGIEIYLGNRDVTNDFSVRLDESQKRFYISKQNASYGNYKILVRYSNSQSSDTYLNNFYVTHGLIGEEVEFDDVNNAIPFTTGKDLEYYSFNASDKTYAIYTNSLSGNVSFITSAQSVYSEKNMAIPTLSYQIQNGESCKVTHAIKSNSGYELNYSFNFIYCQDLSMQPVRVYYDLSGGVNHGENYSTELASAENKLCLFAPSREGYDFVGWRIENSNLGVFAEKNGDSYLVDWNVIHHLGDSPTLYAKSYYNEHYNNSSVLFVRAVWEKSPAPVPPEKPNGVATGVIITLSTVSLASLSALLTLLIKLRKSKKLL